MADRLLVGPAPWPIVLALRRTKHCYPHSLPPNDLANIDCPFAWETTELANRRCPRVESGSEASWQKDRRLLLRVLRSGGAKLSESWIFRARGCETSPSGSRAREGRLERAARNKAIVQAMMHCWEAPPSARRSRRAMQLDRLAIPQQQSSWRLRCVRDGRQGESRGRKAPCRPCCSFFLAFPTRRSGGRGRSSS